MTNLLHAAIGLAQATTEMHFAPRGRYVYKNPGPSQRPGSTGFRATPDAGRYTLTGSDVLVRAMPSATSNVLGTLSWGDSVEVLGDPVETDAEYMVGANGIAVLNDGSSDGIDYVHVGTENYGAGWVAADFLEKAVTAASPAPRPVPTTTPTPSPSTTTAAPKSYVTPILIGGLIGMAVVGSVALGIREYNKQRRHAHA